MGSNPGKQLEQIGVETPESEARARRLEKAYADVVKLHPRIKPPVTSNIETLTLRRDNAPSRSRTKATEDESASL